MFHCNISALTVAADKRGLLPFQEPGFDVCKIMYVISSATFKCVASNSFGVVTKTFLLNVLGRLSIIIMLP